ncbi:hypothetical protein AB4Y45_35155 [Paraburkholderia sp. EG287A]|uniref:hypothetical protein n=1 Tax=Paraburkholderia sp. EG287A TaxID=3237012 RepID=UPI0034D1C9C7
MLAAVDFISLAEFEALQVAPDMAAISIGDPDDRPPRGLACFERGLRLHFLDLEPADAPSPDAPGLFTPFQAREVLEFVSQLHGAAARVRVVTHCRMGASRSAAVALLVHALTGCDFPRRPDAHYANAHVVGVCAEVCGLEIGIPRFFETYPHEYLPPGLQI